MQDDWQQTNQIVMSVQTAELRLAGVKQSATLNLSCSLVNIARGQCQLELAAGEADKKEDIGNLVIEIDRPLIRGKAIIPRSLHDSFVMPRQRSTTAHLVDPDHRHKSSCEPRGRPPDQ
ncbi:MAG: hypothetical protein CM15mP60_1770 [Alphaproteobacteria bacterium]|nr:MAG: hypothetical protein CM15mP60_1770 [Alphaproteobacteria bacterium]